MFSSIGPRPARLFPETFRWRARPFLFFWPAHV
jgi:hypothetical protein